MASQNKAILSFPTQKQEVFPLQLGSISHFFPANFFFFKSLNSNNFIATITILIILLKREALGATWLENYCES